MVLIMSIFLLYTFRSQLSFSNYDTGFAHHIIRSQKSILVDTEVVYIYIYIVKSAVLYTPLYID